MKSQLAASLLAISLVGTLVRAESPPTQPAAMLHDEHYFQSLRARLGDSGFATRKAAQDELHTLPLDDRPALEKLLADTANPEIKASLTECLLDMADKLAVNPPPLALDLKDASLADVARALSTLTGVTIEGPDSNRRPRAIPGHPEIHLPPDPNDVRFTLTNPRISFWDALDTLSHQHPIHIERNSRQGGFTLSLAPRNDDSSPLQERWIHLGNFALIPLSMRRRDIPPQDQNDSGPAGEIDFRCRILADPRLHIVETPQLLFTDVRDNANNEFTQVGARPRGAFNGDLSQGESIWDVESSFQYQNGRGLFIRSGICTITATVQTRTRTLRIDNIEQKQHQDIPIGQHTVNFHTFDFTPKELRMKIWVDQFDVEQRRAQLQHRAPNIPNLSPPIRYKIIDGRGSSVTEGTLSGGNFVSVGKDGIAPPFQLELSIPEKTAALSTSVPLNHLPLP